MKRVVLIVLDSVGIGEAPDAADYGDAGAATLPHLAAAVGGLNAPHFQKLGLGCIPPLVPTLKPIQGVAPADKPLASYGVMQEVSEGKDTVTGHWEIAGLYMRPGFRLMPPGPPSFASEIIAAFEQQTGRKVIGNKAASGTAIIDELGPEHVKTGAWIIYTSADSVFQIAAHEEIIPLEELYRACAVARKLCDPLRIGRVIARPFVGTPGAFERTTNRRDFAFQPSEPTLLERLKNAGVPVYAIGKIEDIYAHRGITEADHTGGTEDSQQAVERYTREKPHGLIFANYIDFDMIFGHRRDAEGYARAIEQTDRWLGGYLPRLGPDDLLILTADHGNDPTFKGSDHTREYVPLLVYRPGQPARNLGVRQGYYDVAQSIAAYFGIDPIPRGVSFLR
jgi:phosphopentomutase